MLKLAKLLNQSDRERIKQSTPDGPAFSLTTPGLGLYSCSNCQYHQGAGGPYGDSTCEEIGVSGQSIPCSVLPKTPMQWFTPKEIPDLMASNPARYTLEQALVMLGRVTRRVEAVMSEAGTPFRVGDAVSFIHDHAIQSGIVAAINKADNFVQVEFGPATNKVLIAVPFGAVMVPPRNT